MKKETYITKEQAVELINIILKSKFTIECTESDDGTGYYLNNTIKVNKNGEELEISVMDHPSIELIQVSATNGDEIRFVNYSTDTDDGRELYELVGPIIYAYSQGKYQQYLLAEKA